MTDWACLLLLGLSLWGGAAPGLAGELPLWREEEQRFLVGLKLFPACLGAVASLEEKRSLEGELRILVVYEGQAETAWQAVRRLDEIKRIRGLPLRVSALSAGDLERAAPPVAAIFVASLEVPGARLRHWSERFQALVFSPFTGAVEQGAVAGIHVADRILPYINRAQAERARVHFKPFFLQVARQL